MAPRWGLSSCVMALALWALPAAAQALPPDKALDKSETQFLETDFDGAIDTLRAALSACTPATCSKAVRAKLHMAVGLVLAGGKRQLEDAKDAFLAALDLDPEAKPNPELVTEEVDYAYGKARKEMGLGPAAGTKPEPKEPEPPKPAPKKGDANKPKPKPEPDEDDDDDFDEAAFDGDPNANWLSLSFAPDLAILTSTSDVCLPSNQNANHYVCARQDGSRYDGQPTLGDGDNINAGPALATLRLMLGYDRILAENFSVGIRLGFAFRGAAEADASFLPLHLEARVAYWFREKPFEFAQVRPYVMLAGGLAQIDTRVDPIHIKEDGNACGAGADPSDPNACTVATGQDPNRVEPRIQDLRAYRQSGLGFAAGGLGVAIAPVPLMQIGVAFRVGVTFPAVTAVLQPELGVGFGF